MGFFSVSPASGASGRICGGGCVCVYIILYSIAVVLIRVVAVRYSCGLDLLLVNYLLGWVGLGG